MLGVTGQQQYITPYTAEFPVMLAKGSAVWNPILRLSHHAVLIVPVGMYIPTNQETNIRG